MSPTHPLLARHPRRIAVGLLAIAALVAAPRTLSAQARAPKGPSAATPAVDTRAALQDLDRYIPKALADWNGAGVAVGIVLNDSLIYAKGFGVREVGKPELVDDRTVFAIGSNSKFFTAVAAGMLADDGKLTLDDKVTKHLPWFQLYDPWVTREITLRDVMSHRSGLGRRGDNLWYGTPYSRDEVIRRVRYLVPNSSFRTEFGYQNIMFLTAGQVIAAAAGKSWDDVIRERIFEPLGMTSSNTSVTQLAGMPNVAQPHNLDPTAQRPTPIPYLNIDNVAPAGSINSNVQDMARWMRFILANGKANGRELLKPLTLADIETPHTIAGRVVGDTINPTRHFSTYGLGIGLSDLHGAKVLQHTGGIDGMLSFVAMVPERGLGIVVLTNVAGHNALYTALGTRILNTFLGGATRDWSTMSLEQARKGEQAAADAAKKRWNARVQGTSPSRPLAEYAATYRSQMYGDLTVSLEDGALVLRYPNAITLRLTHLNYDTFLGAAPTAGPLTEQGLTVRFTLDASGKVASVSADGMDEFKKVNGASR
ncbi:MAG: serine hydrolase [Gemmatimonadaceae bacterium]|nr:serine hydrolase [Gemmatimonadaceae bacterium]